MAESEFFWNQLLGYIEAGNVVPVVGEGLLEIESESGRRFLYASLARSLADYLGVPTDDLTEDPSLNEVACRYLESSREARRDDIYFALKQIMPGPEALPVPAPLAKLARIRNFRLFVSTTFDSMLAQALDEVAGYPATQVFAYSPERVVDLPSQWQDSRPRTVFHLLGRLSTEPSYAVTDEDVLELFHALQSENRQPERLLDCLDKAHLLILGCRFDNWLARFFLRTTVRKRLCVATGTDYLADSRTLADPQLMRFLRSFSARTKLFESGGAIEFVNELSRRWTERHPDGQSSPPPDAEVPELAPGTIFLSYASEDLAVAQRIQLALGEVGIVDVWLDKTHLAWGDRWEPKIERCIEQCAFFLPIISGHTLTRKRRHFRTEWRLAEKEALKANLTASFLLPVVVDQTGQDHPAIPEAFRAAQWRRLEPGDSTATLALELQRLVRGFRRDLRGIA